MAQYISYVLIAVGIFTIYMALVSFFRKDRNLQRAQQIGVTRALKEDEEKEGGIAVVLDHLLMLIGINVRQQRDAATQLSQAGINSQSALVYFLFFKRVMQPVLLVLGVYMVANVLLFSSVPMNHNLDSLIISLLVIVAGAYGSKLFLSNATARRMQALALSFPEALDLMLICVESGLGVDAAFGRVCKEIKDTHPIISSEFERTRFEMSVMSDRVQALQNFADRTGFTPIRSFVSSLVQAERFGTSLVETIRLIAEEQRTERMMNAEKRAARLPAMITIPLIICILPALIMVILGPIVVKVIAQGGIFGGH